MRGPFETIEDFLCIRENCVFCQRKLKCVLSSFDVGPRSLPIFNAYVQNNKLEFDFHHTSATWQINAQISIDIKSNLLSLKLNEPITTDELNTLAIDHIVAKGIFENLNPHVELYCSNRKCKMKYTLCGSMLKSDKVGDEISIFKIRPFYLYMETFELDNLWIQNDWSTHALNIYIKNKIDTAPIKYPELLDLQEMGKDKIITRIKTLVTYS